jgi:hypothetical protein
MKFRFEQLLHEANELRWKEIQTGSPAHGALAQLKMAELEQLTRIEEAEEKQRSNAAIALLEAQSSVRNIIEHVIRHGLELEEAV